MKQKGFTLVELLAVIVILAIILIIAVPQISDVVANQRAAAFKSGAKLVKKAVETAAADDGDAVVDTATEVLALARVADADYSVVVTALGGTPNAAGVRIDGDAVGACAANERGYSISADASPGKFAGTPAIYTFCVITNNN